jgi:hypothetical protein
MTACAVTLTCLTAFFRGNVVVIDGTLIALFAHHVRQAWALASVRVADSSAGRIRAQGIANTSGTLLFRGITKESIFTNVTAFASRVVQTSETVAGAGIAVTRLRQISVTVALALVT